ncbi:MAG: L,D-transpeptidase family protein [Geobacteraceae bacterium]|nr:L,D-transpeptidase family protein [Geobacteraceae bacterium]
MMKKILWVLVVFLCSLPGQAPASIIHADKVVVIKKKRLLLLMRDGEILRKYRVAIGRNPVGTKTRQGDGKTPEGEYVLDRRNPRSRFYRSIHISYPNTDDVNRAQSHGVAPGCDIMIHGLPRNYEDVGELHTVTDWTKGCIAVTNTEIDEIWSFVPDGTPIEIRP